MGHIVDGVLQRLRAELGHFASCDYERLVKAAGLDLWYCDLPTDVPAFLHNDCVYVQRGLSQAATAALVGHECGHAFQHAGGRAFWLSRPQGHLTVAKFEHQANEFAAMIFLADE